MAGPMGSVAENTCSLHSLAQTDGPCHLNPGKVDYTVSSFIYSFASNLAPRTSAMV